MRTTMCGKIHLVMNVYYGSCQDDGYGKLGDHDIANKNSFLFVLVL